VAAHAAAAEALHQRSFASSPPTLRSQRLAPDGRRRLEKPSAPPWLQSRRGGGSRRCSRTSPSCVAQSRP
jgi:hypothetical protein